MRTPKPSPVPTPIAAATRSTGDAAAPVRVRVLLAAGIAAPVVRVVELVVSGALTPGYSHVRDAISELGAVGADTAVLHRVATSVVAALQGGFAAELWRRRHRLLAAAVVVSAVGYLGSALFSPSPGLPVPGDAAFRTRDALHAAFGVPTGIALVAAPLAGLRLELGASYRRWTLVAAVLAIVLGAVSLVLSDAPTRGLWQRAFNVPAFAWQAYLAALLLRRRSPVAGG